MNGHTMDTTAFGFKLGFAKLTFGHLLKPYVLKMLLGCLLLLISNCIVVFLPILINTGVSLVEGEETIILNLPFGTITFNNIHSIVLTIALLSGIGAVIRTLSRMVVFDIGRAIEKDVRGKLFLRLSLLDDRFFLKTSVGDLMNHLTSDTANIRMVTGFALLNLINMIFVFCFTLPLLLRIDLSLALVAMLPAPLVVLASWGLSKKMFIATREYQEKLGATVNHVQESLLGAQVIRLFSQQDREGERFFITNQETYRSAIKLAKARVLMLPMMRLMVGVAVGFVLLVGGRKVLLGVISLGDFVEVNARILQMAWPAMSIGFVMSVYSRGRASLYRINNLLSYMPSVVDGKKDLGRLTRIEVAGFRVADQAEGKISFSVQRGEMVGIVGRSGSFKTTLLQALSRRLPISRGLIFFEGHDILELNLRSIYRHLSVVTEEAFLFQGSIKENLSFLRPDAGDQEIDEVIGIVRLDRDIRAFKHGLDTMVGERGITLSGGQRQRMALARALLARRKAILLDDALSSVDAETEAHIISHLRNYLSDSIVIIATHRLSAIRDADEILVLDKGQIVERGIHEFLLKEGKIYPELWASFELEERLS